jgi:hypothetical protein
MNITGFTTSRCPMPGRKRRDDVIYSKTRFFAIGLAFFPDKNAKNVFFQRSFFINAVPVDTLAVRCQLSSQ